MPQAAVDGAIREYVAKLTRTPAALTNEDVLALDAVGLSGRQILETNLIASYFAFVNRIALGLGVELEPYWS